MSRTLNRPMLPAVFPCGNRTWIAQGYYWPHDDEHYVAPRPNLLPMLEYDDAFPTRRVLVGWWMGTR